MSKRKNKYDEILTDIFTCAGYKAVQTIEVHWVSVLAQAIEQRKLDREERRSC